MKKYAKFLSVVALTVVFLTGCSNFLSGVDLKEELTELIADINAQTVAVSLYSNTKEGIVNPSGSVNFKLGREDKLISFTESKEYSFQNWEVRTGLGNDAVLLEQDVDYIIEDEENPVTKIKILKHTEGMIIVPVCIERIAEKNEPSPAITKDGVSRDRSINVRFTKVPDPSCFVFDQSEVPEDAVTEVNEAGEIVAYKLNDLRYFKNISITDSNGESLCEYFNPPVIESEDPTLLTVSSAKLIPIDVTGYRMIEVTIDSSVCGTDKIPMNREIKWNYKINESTEDKTTVTVTSQKTESGSPMGTATPAVTNNKYNVGSTITLGFSENTDFQFIKWECDKPEIIEILEPLNPSSKAFIWEKTEGNDIATITAKCEPRLKVNSVTPGKNTVCPRDSEIILEFDHDIPYETQEDKDQLNDILITVDGKSVTDLNFKAAKLSESNKVIFKANKEERIVVAEGQTKKVKVTVPAEFYYKLEDGTKVTVGGNGYSYEYAVNNETTERAKIEFVTNTAAENITPSSGTIHEYSMDENVQLNFNLEEGYCFKGWTVIYGGTSTSVNAISISNPMSLTPVLTVHDAVDNVKVKATAYQNPDVTNKNPNPLNPTDVFPKDSDIVITFNNRMNASSVINGLSITYGGESVASYYGTPYFDSTGKILTIPSDLSNLMTVSESRLITVTVPKTAFYTADDNTSVYFNDDYSWSFRINNSISDAPSEFVSIKASKYPDFSDCMTSGTFDSLIANPSIGETGFFTDKYHVAKIYMNLDIYDLNGGLERVDVKEKLLYYDYGEDARNSSSEYTSSIYASEFNVSDSHYTKQFVFDFNELLMDGIVEVTFVPVDVYGKEGTSVVFSVVKDNEYSPYAEFHNDSYNQIVASNILATPEYGNITDAYTEDLHFYEERKKYIAFKLIGINEWASFNGRDYYTYPESYDFTIRLLDKNHNIIETKTKNQQSELSVFIEECDGDFLYYFEEITGEETNYIQIEIVDECGNNSIIEKMLPAVPEVALIEKRNDNYCIEFDFSKVDDFTEKEQYGLFYVVEDNSLDINNSPLPNSTIVYYADSLEIPVPEDDSKAVYYCVTSEDGFSSGIKKITPDLCASYTSDTDYIPTFTASLFPERIVNSGKLYIKIDITNYQNDYSLLYAQILDNYPSYPFDTVLSSQSNLITIAAGKMSPYPSSFSVLVYGVKNGKVYKSNSSVIVVNNDAENDYARPSISCSFNSRKVAGNSIVLNIYDNPNRNYTNLLNSEGKLKVTAYYRSGITNGASLDLSEVKQKFDKLECYFTPSDDETYCFPIDELYLNDNIHLNNNICIYFFIEDVSGNEAYFCDDFEITTEQISLTKTSNGDAITFNITNPEEYNYLFAEQFDSNTESWERKYTGRYLDTINSDTENILENGKFIKIWSSAGFLYSSNVTYWLYAQDTVCHTKSYIYNNMLTVIHDKPVFVHTIYSKIDFGSNIDDWERYCLNKINPVVIDPAVTGTTFNNYDIDTAGIPKGCYYTVIMHYADGTSESLPSKQKQ